MKKYLILTLLLFPFFVSAHADGTLIKADSDKVYVIHNNHKRWIKTAEIFNSYNWDWGKIKIASSNIPDTRLIKGDTDKVFYLENGKKRWILNPEVFNAYKFNWKDIETLNQTDFNSYPAGKDLAVYVGSIKVFLTPYNYNGKCLPASLCLPLASRKGNDVLNLLFEGDGVLTKLVIKQHGTLSDYKLFFNGVQGEAVGDIITFYPNFTINYKDRQSVLADFYEEGTIQFSVEDMDFELNGKPVRYEIGNTLDSFYEVNL